MNNKLNKFLLNLAMLLMIAELSYINSKSLLHLAGSAGTIHQVFAIVGAIAFSIVTIRVMQEDGMRWQKILFPVFDAALVFLGFNLNMHPDMRIYLTIFMALFAGIIMYSLGLIEYNSGANLPSSELLAAKDRANSLGKQLDSLKKVHSALVQKLNDSEAKLNQKHNQCTSLQTQFNKSQTQIELMRPIYMASEKGRILKKKEENRTPQEVELLASA